MKEEIKISPDKETARAILKMVQTRKEFIESADKNKYPSIIAEGYYEIIKELITALMRVDGYKTLSHESLVRFLAESYRDHFTESEIMFIDSLRKLRNKIDYKGFFIDPEYIDMNIKKINKVIDKLDNLIKGKLK